MRFKAEKTFLMFLVIGLGWQYLKCENKKPSKARNQKILSSFPQNPALRNQMAEDGTDMTISDKIMINKPPSPPLNMCNSKICPEGLVHYHSLHKDFCYALLEAQPFPPKCPFPLFLSVTDSQVKDIYKLFKHHSIWIMAIRNTTDGFGPFEWISKDSNQGLSISNYAQTIINISEKNCLRILNYIPKPVRCQEKHRALCIYPYDSASINKYCRKKYLNSDDYLTCTADSINIENHNCYCETAHGTSRDSFCDTLAEPLLRDQSDLLIQTLQTVYDMCWVGLYVNESGVPRWTNSNTTANYSCWSSDVDYSKSFGAINFISDGGWMLADDDGTIQCGICELKNVYDKNVSLQLKYNPSSNSVELRIKYPFEISDYFGGHYMLFCFAGPTLYEFKQNVSEAFSDFDVSLQSSPEIWVGHFTNAWDFPIYYWCEGFQHPNLKPIYSNKILVNSGIHGYEYSMRIKIRTKENKDPYLNESHLRVRKYILNKMNLRYPHELRVMKVLNYDQKVSQMDLILHLTTKINANEQREYKYLQNLLDKLFAEDLLILNITYFERTDVCRPSTTDSNNKKLHWPKTIIGATILPLEICLQDNGHPVMRKCEGDFIYGGFWSEVIGKCTDGELSETSKELNQLLNEENITAQELSGNLSLITSDNQDVIVVDVYLISKILERLDSFENDVNITDVVTIISNIMNFKPNVLKQAQEMLNCTDNILYSMDNILGKSKSITYKVFASKRVLVQVADVRTTSIIGLALKGNASDDFEPFTLIPLYKNISMEVLLDDTIELAAFLPNQLIWEIENCIPPELPIKLLMILFYNDVLFNEKVEETRESNSRILNILIPDFLCTFSTPIPIMFKPLYATGFEKKCAFWKYGVDDIMGNNMPGFWAQDGSPQMVNNTNKTYAVCFFDHITHFALLMMGSFTKEIISAKHVLALDIITVIGTALSLGSFLTMFFIAIFLKNWRQRSSNKILLNFSVAIALQMILLYVANNLNQDGIWCVMIGAALHYTLVSEFLWMLTIAFLQYRKFVTVFYQQIPNLIGKSCTICWCFPLIPVVLLLAISSDSYKKNIHGLCYPSDVYFYVAVILPISLIVVINCIIFIKIIFAICRSNTTAYGAKENDVRLQVLLTLFLFFLLGISWIFGIVLGFGGGIVFSYLFCITATFQGLVMFLFFVVVNENSKTLWTTVRRSLHLHTQHRRTSSSSYSQTQIPTGTGRRSF